MITGQLRSRIDKLWEEFWTGGITNPLTVIEQISFLMFARLQEEDSGVGDDLADGPPGLNESDLIRLFETGFKLEWAERGSTSVPGQSAWTSGWFRFRRSD